MVSCGPALLYFTMEMFAPTDESVLSKETMALPANGKPKGGAPNRLEGVDIIDIRQVAAEANLKEEILTMFLHPKQGLRKLPTLLLYDERGLQLFEEV